MNNNSQDNKTFRIVFIGVMTAIVFVITYLRIPFFGSKLSLGNVFCLLSGLMFGPIAGGLPAGLGSGIYDMVGGYDFIQALITFVSKFAMAWICAKVSGTYIKNKPESNVRIVTGSVVGALSYVVLYMLKTYVYQRFVYGNPLDGALAVMASKLPASLINAVCAFILAPIIYKAIAPILNKNGSLSKVRG
jgi:uncharacterized membrane protein